MNCEDCKFWDSIGLPQEEGAGKGEYVGHCRRFPPQINSLAQKENWSEDGEGDHPVAVAHDPSGWAFAATYGCEWCGEFQPKGESSKSEAEDESTIRQDERELCIEDIVRDCGSGLWCNKDSVIAKVRGRGPGYQPKEKTSEPTVCENEWERRCNEIANQRVKSYLSEIKEALSVRRAHTNNTMPDEINHLPKTTGWIPFNDRRPEKNDCYLVGISYVDYEGSFVQSVTSAEYDADTKENCWRDDSRENDVLDNVTHWMPLPAPPPEKPASVKPAAEESSKRSKEIAVQCWCDPRTSDLTMNPYLAEVFAEKLDAAIKELIDGMDSAWGLIANAYDGDWDKASPESGWKKAAEKWRDGAWFAVASMAHRSDRVETDWQYGLPPLDK